MTHSLTENLIASAICGGPAAMETIQTVESTLGCTFPMDYRDLITRFNGIDGSVDDGIDEERGGWIILWPVEELPQRYVDMEMSETFDRLIGIGSNGAGEAYCIDYSRSERGEYVIVPFISVDREDFSDPCASLEEFLEMLLSGVWWRDITGPEKGS